MYVNETGREVDNKFQLKVEIELGLSANPIK